MTKLEEVARAIREAFPHQRVGGIKRLSWEELGPSDREAWFFMARAAIKALMEPSGMQVCEGILVFDQIIGPLNQGSMLRAYRAMLQAILDEESETV